MSYTITEACNGCQGCTKVCPVQAISGEKKKMHTIDGSACIDCGACGRVCAQGAVHNDRGMLCVIHKRSQWKKPEIDHSLCMSCSVCVDSCPANCLGLIESRDARNLHLYPMLRNDKACLGCGICEHDCPVDAIRMVIH